LSQRLFAIITKRPLSHRLVYHWLFATCFAYLLLFSKRRIRK